MCQLPSPPPTGLVGTLPMLPADTLLVISGFMRFSKMTQGSLWQLEDHGSECLHDSPQSWYQVKSHPVNPPQMQLLCQTKLFVIDQLLSCVWLFETSLDCSTPGFPVLHYFLEFAETHVHWVDDAIHSLILHSPFSSCLQSFSVSGSFPTSWLFTSGQEW